MTDDNGFDQLNREFYATEPSTYFRDRLTLLTVRAARTDALSELMDEGVEWGQMRIGGGDKQKDAPEHDLNEEEVRRQRFVVTESQILLHHASEALLRMFLAHEGRPMCPWIEMASLLNHREFRAKVAELAKGAWPRARIEAVAEVFLGEVPASPDENWTEHRDAAVRLIRLLAERLNSDANLYNSAKHGLTSLAGTGSLTFLTDSGQSVMGVDGVNVTFLEREGARKTGYTWYHRTQWVNAEQAAWLTHMVVVQMDALWTVAQWRYLDVEPPGGQLQLVTNEALDALRTGFQQSGSIRMFRRVVAREDPDAPTPD
jgi:hypothetical protein